MIDRSKGKSQINCSPWSPRLWVGHGANDSTLEKFTVKEPEKKLLLKPWRRPRPTQGCSAFEREELQ
jgi:hypothetical protein